MEHLHKVINAMGSVGAVKYNVEAENTAPKLPACVISWLKSKAKTHPPPASLLHSVLPASPDHST